MATLEVLGVEEHLDLGTKQVAKYLKVSLGTYTFKLLVAEGDLHVIVPLLLGATPHVEQQPVVISLKPATLIEPSQIWPKIEAPSVGTATTNVNLAVDEDGFPQA